MCASEARRRNMFSVPKEVPRVLWAAPLGLFLTTLALPSLAEDGKKARLPPYLENAVNICMHGDWFEENKTCVCEPEWTNSIDQDILSGKFIWCNDTVIKQDIRGDTADSGRSYSFFMRVFRHPLFAIVAVVFVFLLLICSCNLWVARHFMRSERGSHRNRGDDRGPDTAYTSNGAQLPRAPDNLQQTMMSFAQPRPVVPTLAVGNFAPYSGTLPMYQPSGVSAMPQGYSSSEPLAMLAASITQTSPVGYIPQQPFANSMLSVQQPTCVPGAGGNAGLADCNKPAEHAEQTAVWSAPRYGATH